MRSRAAVALALVFLLVLASTIALVPVKPTRAQTASSVPDEVIYRRIFHRVALLKKKADLAQQQGKDRSNLRQLIRKQAGLADYEGTVLEQAALQCETEVSAQDAKAKVIIQCYQAQFPFHFIPKGATVPPPPAELADMQRERNNIILYCRDRLRNAIGEQSFAKFDAYARQSVTPRPPFGIAPQAATGGR